ncbi:MAG TPA: hypothetical protein PKZ72_09455 [Saprospiraceae bacterium]|nr:hypothetical protein [Saprospiraceae bacterium]HNA94925.1 hypothetical protein [Saprospiraceae bacterium]HND17317.1 hypothetical protein [Saprospiraceae bacterium]HNG07295.1 hypothetical protein [Saprospiraceae bacterium]
MHLYVVAEHYAGRDHNVLTYVAGPANGAVSHNMREMPDLSIAANGTAFVDNGSRVCEKFFCHGFVIVSD